MPAPADDDEVDRLLQRDGEELRGWIAPADFGSDAGAATCGARPCASRRGGTHALGKQRGARPRDVVILRRIPDHAGSMQPRARRSQNARDRELRVEMARDGIGGAEHGSRPDRIIESYEHTLRLCRTTGSDDEHGHLHVTQQPLTGLPVVAASEVATENEEIRLQLVDERTELALGIADAHVEAGQRRGEGRGEPLEGIHRAPLCGPVATRYHPRDVDAGVSSGKLPRPAHRPQ